MTFDSENRWSRRDWLSACAFTPSLVGAQTVPATEELRVLLVIGGHSHELSFYSIFAAQHGMKVMVDPHPGAFRDDPTSRYDVLVLYDFIQLDDIDAPRRKNLQKFVENGKGLVVLHHAICNYNQWEWWWRDVAGVRYLTQAEGNQQASTYKHDETLTITPTRMHPILNGVGTMHMTDETYKRMWISNANKILLTTDNPTSDGPVAWISSYEKSRVVVIQPGHGRDAHSNPSYRRLVRNAMFWSAGASPRS